MSKFSPAIISAATLALAGAAHAAPVGIQVGDLNLNSASGQRTLDERAQIAAQTFCHSKQAQHVVDSRACIVGVQAEVVEKAAALRQAQMAQR